MSLGGFSGNARDGSRVSDLANLSKGLDLSYVKSGVYPTPTSATGITYSGAVAWYQGTAGDSVVNLMSAAGIKSSKKPVDPLSNSEYGYSLTAETREYALRADYEGDSIGLVQAPTAVAATGNPTIAYVRGTYNGVVMKVSTGGGL